MENSDSIVEYTKAPAMLYYYFWSLDIEGRLYDAIKDKECRYLLIFTDYPPATIIEFSHGTFNIESISNEEAFDRLKKDIKDFDGWIIGKFEVITFATWNIKKFIASIITRKIIIRKPLKFLLFLKILLYKGPYTSGKNGGIEK